MCSVSSRQMNLDLLSVLKRFAFWLDEYGETSQDHQDFFASKIGRSAKNYYYQHPKVGKLAVAPMIFCEAFIPWTRRFFFPRMRLPIADAHFAMGFALLHQITGEDHYLKRAEHFLEVLEQTRCPGFERHGWGYPFDWQTQGGILKKGTPLITTTPYCYEAFEYVYQITKNQKCRKVMRSIAEHCLRDYIDHETRPGAATCTYTPDSGEYVVNASAYRAGILMQAYAEFGNEDYRGSAEHNIAFVLDSQNEDGSWPYSVEGKRPFIDHFHTCFVLKGLVKAEKVTRDPALTEAIERGVAYYTKNLFAEDGLPKPFARAPRMTVYKRELYDCAECINLGVLLKGRFPDLDAAMKKTVQGILSNWIQPQGCFRGRKLFFGWDNTPMHRWGQSQIFRSLSLFIIES